MPTPIACVRYLNTMPLIAGLDKLADVSLILAAPSHIAAMVSNTNNNTKADIGLVSLVDLARAGHDDDLPEPLAIVPVGMIGSDGPTMTVRLFSTKPIDQTTAVHCDSESHTSGVLCKILLKELHGLEPDFIEFDAREQFTPNSPDAAGRPDTILLIGDKVVTDAPDESRYPHQLDLGDAWKRLTSLPFVYATWMCRKADAREPHIATAAAVLDRQRRHNQTRLDALVTDLAPSFHWPASLARLYVGDLLRYDLDDRAREAIGVFLDKAAALGACPRCTPAYADTTQALGAAN